ncbi:MAG: hypothetical protein QGG09_12630 [Pirellulaceae bacterium]|jgi:hypothetical protein|nr:hypothetical protein [Pirellulaceae bacterium]HJN08203.1 hypothetical protein [Pirellulaceae bacterium]
MALSGETGELDRQQRDSPPCAFLGEVSSGRQIVAAKSPKTPTERTPPAPVQLTRWQAFWLERGDFSVIFAAMPIMI